MHSSCSPKAVVAAVVLSQTNNKTVSITIKRSSWFLCGTIQSNLVYPYGDIPSKWFPSDFRKASGFRLEFSSLGNHLMPIRMDRIGPESRRGRDNWYLRSSVFKERHTHHTVHYAHCHVMIRVMTIWPYVKNSSSFLWE